MSWLTNKLSRFSSDGKSGGTKKIICPHCGTEQVISSRTELTFCKKCNKIINAKKAKVVSESEEHAQENKNDIKKDYKEYKEPEKTSEKLVEKEEYTAPVVNDVKKVRCSHCNTVQEVPTIALSSFCKKCGQRINLQDYEIRGKFQGELDTRGTIIIAENAEVKADINVGSAVVKGKIQGVIIAEKSIKLTSTGKIFGEVITPNFIVEDGAIFVGKAQINAGKR